MGQPAATKEPYISTSIKTIDNDYSGAGSGSPTGAFVMKRSAKLMTATTAAVVSASSSNSLKPNELAIKTTTASTLKMSVLDS